MQLNRLSHKGFTLIEMLVVLTVIGILMLLIAPSLKSSSSGAMSKQIYDFTSRAASNWRLLAINCGTTGDVTTSPVVTTPSAANSLGLIVTGSSLLKTATYQSCWDATAIQPLHTKATGNVTDGFKVAGFPVTWSGGSGSTPISFVVVGVPVEIALPLYRQYSSAAGAQTSSAMPTTADTTDPLIQFTAPATGVTTLTLLFP